MTTKTLTDQDQIKLNKDIIQDKEDAKELFDIITIQNNLINYIGIEKFINAIREYVSESEVFEFTNISSEKFIDPKKPIFKLKIMDNVFQEYIKPIVESNKELFESQDQFAGMVTSSIHSEILVHTSKYMEEHITSNEELTEKFNKLEDAAKVMVLSIMYSINVSNPVDNKVFLTMIL